MALSENRVSQKNAGNYIHVHFFHVYTSSSCGLFFVLTYLHWSETLPVTVILDRTVRFPT